MSWSFHASHYFVKSQKRCLLGLCAVYSGLGDIYGVKTGYGPDVLLGFTVEVVITKSDEYALSLFVLFRSGFTLRFGRFGKDDLAP